MRSAPPSLARLLVRVVTRAEKVTRENGALEQDSPRRAELTHATRRRALRAGRC